MYTLIVSHSLSSLANLFSKVSGADLLMCYIYIYIYILSYVYPFC